MLDNGFITCGREVNYQKVDAAHLVLNLVDIEISFSGLSDFSAFRLCQ